MVSGVICHCTGLTRKLGLKFSICQLTYISILVYDHQLWIREAQISKGISVWYHFETSQLITVQVFFILPNISILSAYLSYSWNSFLHDYLSFFNLVNGFCICWNVVLIITAFKMKTNLGKLIPDIINALQPY